MSKLDDGAVEVTVAGETYSMVATMDMKKKVNRHFGGLKAAIDRVQGVDMDAIASVICIGADVPRKDQAAVVDAVYDAEDLGSVIGPVSEFLGIVLMYRKSAEGNGAKKTSTA